MESASVWWIFGVLNIIREIYWSFNWFVQPCRTLPRPLTPTSILDSTCWVITEDPTAAQVYTNSSGKVVLENGQEVENGHGNKHHHDRYEDPLHGVLEKDIYTRPLTDRWETMWPDILSVHLHDPGLKASYKSTCDDYRESELSEGNIVYLHNLIIWNLLLVVDSHAHFVCLCLHIHNILCKVANIGRQ